MKLTGRDMNKFRLSADLVTSTHTISRRAVLLGLPLFVGGCVTADYGAVHDRGQLIPAVDFQVLDPNLQRTEVAWRGKEKPGSIVVRISERRLYLVQDGGRALRYAVGVGRSEGVNFRGTATIARKEAWPHWTPTENMMQAIPMYRRFAGGMDGGIENPLGARALYLYRGGRDTHFRLHGTTEPDSIGKAVSSGCIRLFNQDIIDLYNRVPVGTQVTVIS
jgi:lipoprotein-anchoring transpeptidase ErfK/SrfK